MECTACNAEWDSEKAAQMLCCPFCNASIYEIPKGITDLESALSFLVKINGKSHLLDKRTALKNLEICIPNQKSELNFFKIAHENGIVNDLVALDIGSVSDHQVAQQKIRSIHYLQENFGLANEWAKYIVETILCAIGYSLDKDESSIVSLEKKAQKGDAVAQYELALKYKSGTDTSKQNTGLFIKWLTSSANSGFSKAQYDLGLCYLWGSNMAKDNEQAIHWLKKSAHQQYALAQYALGMHYIENYDQSISVNEIIDFLEAAGENGKSDGFYQLGMMYEDCLLVQKEIEKAIEYFSKAISKGNTDAKIRLGLCMLRRNNSQFDSITGQQHLKEAAAEGSAEAMYVLGTVYEEGIGVPSNYNNALFWYKTAAEIGNEKSQFKMGYFYENGLSVSKDINEAAEWYYAAANYGHETAHQKISYKSPICILKSVEVSFEDGTDLKCPFEGMIEYAGTDYMIVRDPETNELYPFVYTETADYNFEIHGLESEQEESTILRLFKKSH